LLETDEMVSPTPSHQESEVDHDEILPTRGPAELGVHGHDPRSQRQGLADPTHGCIRSEGPPVDKDSEWSQPLRSGVGTLPGAENGLETGPYSGRSKTDRVPLEEPARALRGVRANSSCRRTALAHPPSGLAQPRRSGHMRQLGVVTCQLPSTSPLASGIAEEPRRVLRGALVKARAVCVARRLYGSQGRR